MDVKKDPELAKRAVKIRKIFRLRQFYGNLVLTISRITIEVPLSGAELASKNNYFFQPPTESPDWTKVPKTQNFDILFYG